MLYNYNYNYFGGIFCYPNYVRFSSLIKKITRQQLMLEALSLIHHYQT